MPSTLIIVRVRVGYYGVSGEKTPSLCRHPCQIIPDDLMHNAEAGWHDSKPVKAAAPLQKWG